MNALERQATGNKHEDEERQQRRRERGGRGSADDAINQAGVRSLRGMRAVSHGTDAEGASDCEQTAPDAVVSSESDERSCEEEKGEARRPLAVRWVPARVAARRRVPLTTLGVEYAAEEAVARRGQSTSQRGPSETRLLSSGLRSPRVCCRQTRLSLALLSSRAYYSSCRAAEELV